MRTRKLNFLIALTLSTAVAAHAGLVVADSDTDELIAVDAATGAGTAIGATGFQSIIGLTYDTSTNTLYGIDTSTDQLLTIDPATGAGAVVGPVGTGAIGALAYDSDSDTLYGSDLLGSALVTLDRNTGTVTQVGLFNIQSVQGLAYDPNTDTLYGTSNTTNQLLTINKATGAASVVGATGFSTVSGLTFDPNANILYGVDSATDQLITIDPATGLGSAVGPLGFGLVNAIAWIPTCTVDQTLTYSGGTLTLDYSLGTSTPGMWKVFLSANGTTFPVINFNLPVAVDPAVPVSIPVPNFPSLGVVGSLTTLTIPGVGIGCSDWDTINTGQPAPGGAANLQSIIQRHQR